MWVVPQRQSNRWTPLPQAEELKNGHLRAIAGANYPHHLPREGRAQATIATLIAEGLVNEQQREQQQVVVVGKWPRRARRQRQQGMNFVSPTEETHVSYCDNSCEPISFLLVLLLTVVVLLGSYAIIGLLSDVPVLSASC